MSEKFLEDDKIKAMLRKAESEPVPFAFAPGAKPADHVLMLNPAKAPKALLADIGKLRPDSERGTFGMARVNGKELILDCQKRFAGLGKLVRAMLRERGFKQNEVTVLIGGVAASDEADLPADPAGPASATPPAPTAAGPAPTAAGPAPISAKALATAAAAWDKAVKLAKSEIQKLRRAVVSQFKSQPGAKELAASTRGLDDALADLDSPAWAGALAAALQDGSPESVAELQKQAARMRKSIEKNGVLDLVDNNPFTPIKAKATLLNTLDVIQGKLG